MGCFTISRTKKKKPDKSISIKRIDEPQHSPTVLPEPQIHTRSLQSAPPSFRTRAVKPAQPNKNRAINSRTRALSAPSSLDDVTEQDTLIASNEVIEQNEPKLRLASSREYNAPNPQPLPLPSPSSALKTMSSFKKMKHNSFTNLDLSGPLPLPPTLLSTNKGMLVNFSLEEIASACHNFSPERCVSEGLSSVIYRASFEDKHGSTRVEANVTRLHPPPNHGFKEFVNEVNMLASLQHPLLCKLIGYHAREGSDQRMLVFERLHHGNLDRLLHGRCDGPPVDWNSRMKVALCAAQGLTFLHEEGPFQAMFHEFSTANIQIDKDFSAKLSGYGCCVSHIPETEVSSSPAAIANLSVETLERSLLTPKSNVWSFGIVLLELLTGRKNLDTRLRKEERNLVTWTRPYLSDDSRLSLIMDPQLKGRFPSKAARTIADIAQKCLQTDPSERPTMRAVVKCLRTIQDMKLASRFPLQEPRSISGKHMGRSISFNGIVHHVPRSSVTPSLMSKSPVSPNRVAFPLALPPRTCSSTLSLEDFDRQENRKLSSSTLGGAGVEGM